MSSATEISALRAKICEWQAVFPVAGTREREALCRAYRAVLGRIDYGEILRGGITLHHHPMLELYGRYDVTRRNTELVEIDVATLWAEAARDLKYPAHAVEDTPDGFRLTFAARNHDDLCLNGVLNMTCRR